MRPCKLSRREILGSPNSTAAHQASPMQRACRVAERARGSLLLPVVPPRLPSRSSRCTCDDADHTLLRPCAARWHLTNRRSTDDTSGRSTGSRKALVPSSLRLSRCLRPSSKEGGDSSGAPAASAAKGPPRQPAENGRIISGLGSLRLQELGHVMESSIVHTDLPYSRARTSCVRQPKFGGSSVLSRKLCVGFMLEG